ncbi:MAG: hypothetical protein A2636_03950 [Elusimicrobia bacterium RIFCSPHIGHO2_01_FULL_64_10]|nr:MAG: hypothetical protein A2636_03950 [Elusimicrobia bacterium RIFCSPHIGHO2_01_FULL_64_10]
MDDWDNVRNRIKELENSFLRSDSEVRSTLDSVSVADFWKRRYEEEKLSWEDALAAKEKEQGRIQSKFLEDEQNIREMSFKLKELEQRMASERALWEERSKVGRLEAELEKKKVEWDDKTLLFRDEIERLRSAVRSAQPAPPTAKPAPAPPSADATRLLEEERQAFRRQIEAITQEGQKKIQALESERQALDKQIKSLESFSREGKEKSATLEQEMALLVEERSRKLSQIEEREKEHFRTFEDMARGFAHKIRVTMGVVSGSLNSCLSDPEAGDAQKARLSATGESAREVLTLIEDFLALAETPDAALMPCDPNRIAAAALGGAEDAAKAAGARLEKSLAENLNPIQADEALLTGALKQLILNAVEASPGGSAVIVATEGDPDSGSVRFKIADSGPGIAEDMVRKAFQPFFTTKKKRKGLGLTIAKRAVDLHHGTLTVTSAPGKGTLITVEIFLPRP